VTCLAFSPDGRRLVSADEHALRLWDVATGKELPTADGHWGLSLPWLSLPTAGAWSVPEIAPPVAGR
jgi:WD40 repeat protein